LARPFESLGGARREVLEGRVGPGPLPGAGIEVRRPVAGRLVLGRDHRSFYCKPRVTERKRPSSSSRATDTPGTAMRPSFPMVSLTTSACCPLPNQRELGSRSDG